MGFSLTPPAWESLTVNHVLGESVKFQHSTIKGDSDETKKVNSACLSLKKHVDYHMVKPVVSRGFFI